MNKLTENSFYIDKNLLEEYAVSIRLSENLTYDLVSEINAILEPYGYACNTNNHLSNEGIPKFYSLFGYNELTRKHNVVVHSPREFAEHLFQLAENLLNEECGWHTGSKYYT